MPPTERVRRAEISAYLVAIAGAAALLAFGLFSAFGQPFGTLNDLLLLAMTLTIAPIMLGSYELGGVTPLWPARFSLAGGIGAVLVWSAVQVLMIGGAVRFDYGASASGAFAVEAGAVIVMGLWITGAPLLAGPWLPGSLRWLGAASGIGFVIFGIGLLHGGVMDPLTYVGGVGYQILFPIWAFLLGRLLGKRDGA